jgi:chorismate lyase/3-hydroxybenzoate synthase
LSDTLAPAVAYVDAHGLHDLQAACAERVLGVLGYGARNGMAIGRDVAQVWTGLGTRDGGAHFEAWLSPTPVSIETQHGTRCAYNDEVLFGSIEFDAGDEGEFQQHALAHYLRMFALLDRCGYPHLLRVWHYLPQIHLEENGLERYKQFSVARHEAFVRSGRDIARDAPAASAVGRLPGSAVIAFLAGKQRGTKIENPRQVSAYRYPGQYGPRGPTFARAACVAWGRQEQLYISGTASIVGHESRHAGDAQRQAEETIRNLCTVLAQASARASSCMPAWQRLLFKVYLRPGVAQDEVLQRLRHTFGDEPDVLVLEADICRRELLLEIEAIGLRSHAAA